MKKNSKQPRLARASKTELHRQRVMTELFETAKAILYGSKSTAS